MNIFKYINSKDIKKHLEDIGYNFTSLEAAWLIYQCKGITLKEKHSAFKELIDTMPDCEIEKRNNTVPQKSLHKFLEKYIAVENRYVKEFCSAENSVYGLRYIYKDGSEGYDDVFYSSFEAVKNAVKTDRDTEKIICEKNILNQKRSKITAEFSANFELLKIRPDCIGSADRNIIFYGVFGGLFFDFPTPFKSGDIVCDKFNKDGFCGGPFVLTEIGLSRFKSKKAQNAVKKYGDSSDMNAEGYFQREDGIVYYEVMHNYMNLEYYREKPTGVKRVLTALGNYEKGEIDLTLLLNAYRCILNDEITEKSRTWQFTKKGLYLAGLLEDEPITKIWLDDIRPAPEGYVWCRSVKAAELQILLSEREEIKIELIDCDHDLGDYAAYGGDGIKLLDWLAETKRFYPVKLHTQNPVGRENMQRIIDRYWPKADS